MPSAASKILQACRQASRAARSAASAASRCAAVVARSGSGGAAASDQFLPSPSRSRPFFGRGRFPVAAPPPRSRGSGSAIAAPPTNIHGPKPGKVIFVAEDKDLESDEALWGLYERWCKAFNEERDHDEMAHRFNLFKKNVLLVEETNKADLPYKFGINRYADEKVLELRSPKIPMREFYKRRPYKPRTPSSAVTFMRSGLFKKELEGHDLKNQINQRDL